MRPIDIFAKMGTQRDNRDDIWRISSIFALRKIGFGNRFNHHENINNVIPQVVRDVNFVLRFLDLGLKLPKGCNNGE